MNKITSFLVGGAVRDQLLSLPVKDRDWVVIGSTPEDLAELGFKQVGADFPVFLHPETKEEYALARTERKQGKGYHGFICDFSPDVTLEQDLARRDLTINAMALDKNGELIDPYNGHQDIEAKILRHVSPAFAEDPLRILRVARFAARYKHLGFKVAKETNDLMQHMVANGEAAELVAERVWQETERALGETSPWVYFEVLRDCGALSVIFPELDKLFGIPQPPKWHPEIDTGVHSLLSLKAACELSENTAVRFASLIHDLGKGLTPETEWPAHHGHETKGLKPIKSLCTRLKAPKDFKELALMTSEFHTHVHKAAELKPSTIHKVLRKCDAMRRPERFLNMLLCCEADAKGRTGLENEPYPQRAYFTKAIAILNNTNLAEVLARGLKGPELGAAIKEEQIRNLKQELAKIAV